MNLKAQEKPFEIDELEYQYLDQLSLSQNLNPLLTSDKSSRWHNYTKIYSFYFSKIKEKKLKFLEIGIDKGNSVQLWENYFPNADLHFIDITLSEALYFPQRSHYHIANQENPSELLDVVKKTGKDGFDIIIDDGGHTMKQQITSFLTLFPYLKSGGIYVIEDLHTSYWKKWPGASSSYGGHGSIEKPRAGTGTTIQFLKDLIDEINYPAARTTRANYLSGLPKNEINIYRESILGIHFYESLCFIIKK
jgi:hypothetical protein